MAAGCDEVVHMVAGVPRIIKSPPGESPSGPKDAAVPEEFTPEKKQGLYDAIYKRRDMRHFQSKPVPAAVLRRILDAAHHAGSVGFMQPWNFLVIKDLQIRQAVARNFKAANEQGAARFTGERRELYASLKLEGILEAPLNICVTCDSTRGGPQVLGRDTIPETDLYSTCCAVQNLWLAARAEGLGVGWVSILSVEFLKETLGIPAHVHPVAYLCVGYPREFYPAPMLEEAGWAQRIPLRQLVFQDQWSRPPDFLPDGD
ncbi:MAG: 5,6-dimethylbenzimidazole synthase [Nitrospinaceae bacterium]